MAEPAVPHFGFDKQCFTCGVVKPLSEFPKAKTAKSGYRRDCTKCRSAAIKDWKLRTGFKYKPEYVQKKKEDRVYKPRLERIRNLAGKFGISTADFDRILTYQGGVCALCRVPGRSSRWGRLVVDHCHETGRIRGLLCARCNSALGLLGDRADTLERAYHYVSGQLDDTYDRGLKPLFVKKLSTKAVREIAQTPGNPQGPGGSAPTRQSDARTTYTAAPTG